MARVVGTGALGVAMVLAAATFGSPSLYVPGIALVLLAVTAWLWVSVAAFGASLERHAGPATVEEERGWPLQIGARTGGIPAPGGSLREPLLLGTLSFTGCRERLVRVNVTFERRGRRVLEPTRLTLGDPFGLFERTLEAGAGQEVLVLPRIEPVTAGGRGIALHAAQPSSSRPVESAAEIEMESLRPYREGAPASRIHWPTVARTGSLMERRLLADSDHRPLVVMDAARPDDLDALDRAVRAAASLAVHLARGGGCALLLPGDRRPTDLNPDLGGWPSLHARLALVEAGAPVATIRMHARQGAIFWVTGSGSGGVPRSLERSSGERYVVSPAIARGDAAFAVAGCAGVAVGRRRRRAA